MPRKPNISKADFAVMAARAGLELSEPQSTELFSAYGNIEQMAETVRRTREIDAEPAGVFVSLRPQKKIRR